MRSAKGYKHPYNNTLLITVDLPLTYLGTDGDYNCNTLFGVKLTASKRERGGVTLTASVHVQTSAHSQTTRIYKDYFATIAQDLKVQRVTAKALESFWLQSCSVTTLTTLLESIEAHYSRVGVA
jgi:hypothetical protein